MKTFENSSRNSRRSPSRVRSAPTPSNRRTRRSITSTTARRTASTFTAPSTTWWSSPRISTRSRTCSSSSSPTTWHFASPARTYEPQAALGRHLLRHLHLHQLEHHAVGQDRRRVPGGGDQEARKSKPSSYPKDARSTTCSARWATRSRRCSRRCHSSPSFATPRCANGTGSSYSKSPGRSLRWMTNFHSAICSRSSCTRARTA